MLTRDPIPRRQETHMRVLAAALVLATGLPALAQQQPQGVERTVLAKRVCQDGATTLVVASGELITVEYFSAPRTDGTVSGYEDAYDRDKAHEAKAQFDALRCPEGT